MEFSRYCVCLVAVVIAFVELSPVHCQASRGRAWGGGGGRTLYTPSDPLTQLDINNFDRTLTRSDTAWMVEFYSAWCGHCQRFAPIYKRYAADVSKWSSVVRVAAIACSDPINTPVCSRQDVRGFPSIRMYLPNMPSVTKGFKMDELRSDPNLIRTKTLQLMEKYLTPSDKIPRLRRFSDIPSLRRSVRSTPRHLLAIVEEDSAGESEMAKSLIMDLSSERPSLVIGRLPRSAFPSGTPLWRPLPNIVSINTNDGTVRFIAQLSSRTEAIRDIRRLLSGQTTPRPTTVRVITTTAAPVRTTNRPSHHPSNHAPSHEYVHSGSSGNAQTHTLRPARPPVTPTDRIPAVPTIDSLLEVSGIRQTDLDSNIYYSLWNEVASRSRIRGKALPALKEYIRILSKYHPGNDRLQSLIQSIHRWIERIGGSLSSNLYRNTIEGLQKNDSYVVKKLEWDSCAGSDQKYRGYPCSLWMTFHALTVAAYEDHLKNPSRTFQPNEVLMVIRNYVKYFFSCRDCAEHFLDMSKRLRHEVHRPQDGLLWLWKSHNRVNNRLHGDSTEDPVHPKIQFPGVQSCPTCRHDDTDPGDRFHNDTNWNEVEVVKFLRKFYRPVTSNVSADDPMWDAPLSESQGTRGSSHSNKCVTRATAWSTCSVTCGVGVSTRFNNENKQCVAQLEMRLCQIRQCNQTAGQYTRGGSSVCPLYAANLQSASYSPLTFGSCTTKNSYRWMYCGLCPGYCCDPIVEKTVWADMTCDGRHRGKARMMWIERCECRRC